MRCRDGERGGCSGRILRADGTRTPTLRSCRGDAAAATWIFRGGERASARTPRRNVGVFKTRPNGSGRRRGGSWEATTGRDAAARCLVDAAATSFVNSAARGEPAAKLVTPLGASRRGKERPAVRALARVLLWLPERRARVLADVAAPLRGAGRPRAALLAPPRLALRRLRERAAVEVARRDDQMDSTGRRVVQRAPATTRIVPAGNGVAATPRVPGWIVRGRVAATPRVPRGGSAGPTAARDAIRRRRGRGDASGRSSRRRRVLSRDRDAGAAPRVAKVLFVQRQHEFP